MVVVGRFDLVMLERNRSKTFFEVKILPAGRCVACKCVAVKMANSHTRRRSHESLRLVWTTPQRLPQDIQSATHYRWDYAIRSLVQRDHPLENLLNVRSSLLRCGGDALPNWCYAFSEALGCDELDVICVNHRKDVLSKNLPRLCFRPNTHVRRDQRSTRAVVSNVKTDWAPLL